jgi:hypothetical protein
LSWFIRIPTLTCASSFEGLHTGKTKNFHFGEFRLDGKLGAAFRRRNPSHSALLLQDWLPVQRLSPRQYSSLSTNAFVKQLPESLPM